MSEASITTAGGDYHSHLRITDFDLDGRQNVTLTQNFRDWGAPLLYTNMRPFWVVIRAPFG